MYARLVRSTAASAATAAALPLACGCGATGAGAVPPPPVHADAKTTLVRAAAPDPMLATAMRRYRQEATGRRVYRLLARVARDQGLFVAMQSQSTARVRAYVARKYPLVWRHWHVTRLLITRGGRVLADAGSPFDVAGLARTLQYTSADEHDILRISVQDVLGYVRFMHRNYGVQIVVRGRGPGRVRTSLPAAAHRHLSDRGRVTIEGRRYRVASFREVGWRGEPLKIWILR
jgi:hypothetical protein